MVNDRFLKAYIHFALIYMTDHIFPFIPIKYLINKDCDPTTPFKLATVTKPSVSHLRVLFCPCVVRKATSHVGEKLINMCHQTQKCFCGNCIGILQHQKGYLVYVPSKRRIISSYDVFLNEIFSSALEYTSQPYSEAMNKVVICMLIQQKNLKNNNIIWRNYLPCTRYVQKISSLML